MRFSFRHILGVLASLRTAIWLLLGLICVLLYGSILMPADEVYGAMNTMPLFEWMRQVPLLKKWWLMGAIILLSALTANTIICSAESIIKKWDREKWLLIISPQIMHIGFLLILVAHLLSSYGALRAMTSAFEGSVFKLSETSAFRITEIRVSVSPDGYITDLRAGVEFMEGDTVIKRSYFWPNNPAFYKGFGLYIKDARLLPVRTALIEVSREPGAPWALAGGVLFSIGTVLLMVLKMKREV